MLRKDSRGTMEDSDAPKAQLSLSILSDVTASQIQNGLRHGDYLRYRQYCSRRLRRLRKSMKFTYGRGRNFQYKRVNAESAESERYLLIPLVNAERAWAYAMQLQQEAANNQENSRIKFHLVRRLAKAARWGKELAEICVARADVRTSLEAEAYAAFMDANLQLERENWEKALENFTKARRIYHELSNVGSLEEQDLLHSKVQKIDPSIRYCKYNMQLLSSSAGSKQSQEDIRHMRDEEDSGGLLQAKLNAVLAAERKKQAEDMQTIEWKGQTIQVPDEEVRIALLRANECEASLKDVETLKKKGGGKQDKAFLEVLSAYDDTLRLINNEIDKLSKMISGQKVEAHKQQLETLKAYATSKRSFAVLHRNLELLRDLHNRYHKKQESSESLKGALEASQSLRPEDLFHMIERVLNAVEELAVADDVHGDSKQLANISTALEAWKSFYAGEVYASASKWPEAYAVFEHTLGQISGEDAVGTAVLGEHAYLGKDTLYVKATAAKCRTQALGFLQDTVGREGVESGLENLSVRPKKKQKKLPPLESRADQWEAGELEQQYNLVQIPPEAQSMPCKPVLFDIAFGEIHVPSLQDKMKSDEQKAEEEANKKGGLWGWFRGS